MNVEEIVNQFGLEVAIYSIGFVSLIHVEDFHPTQISEGGRGRKGRRVGGKGREGERKEG